MPNPHRVLKPMRGFIPIETTDWHNYTKMKAKFRLTVVGVLVKRQQQQLCRFKNTILKS